MNEIKNQLAKVSLPERVFVPQRYEASVAYREKLAKIGAPYGEAQRLKRIICTGLTHVQAEVRAASVMGIVSSYYMCRQMVWKTKFSPEEVLKMLALLGDICRDLGEPTVAVNVATALSPKVRIPADTSHFTRRMKQFSEDNAFWVGRRQADYAHRFGIHKLQVRFMNLKYGTQGGDGSLCNKPRTPEFFPCEWGLDAATFFADNWNLPVPVPSEHPPHIIGCN